MVQKYGYTPLTIKSCSFFISQETSEREQNLQFVGMILNKQPHATIYSFAIEDGTSWLRCKTKDESIYAKLEVGRWYLLIGSLRTNIDDLVFIANSCRLVTCYNEIVFHFIQASKFVAKFRKRNVEVLTGKENQALSEFNELLKAKFHLNPAELKILSFYIINESKNEEGVLIDECIQMHSQFFSKNQIQVVIEKLQSLGLIFATIDSRHHAFTGVIE